METVNVDDDGLMELLPLLEQKMLDGVATRALNCDDGPGRRRQLRDLKSNSVNSIHVTGIDSLPSDTVMPNGKEIYLIEIEMKNIENNLFILHLFTAINVIYPIPKTFVT